MLSRLMNGSLTAGDFLSWLVAVAIAITVHEFAHAKRADVAGDHTARLAGRLSLLPWDHYDPIGTTALLLFGFGWAKPVPTNPFGFKHPRRDGIMVALWGALANLITAAVFGLPLRFGFAGAYHDILGIIVALNLILALFNLIPIAPLDGSHVLLGLLPVGRARRLETFYARWGMVLLILMMFSGQLFRVSIVWLLIGAPCQLLYLLITGSSHLPLF
jgi:Zn-dependent protease